MIMKWDGSGRSHCPCSLVKLIDLNESVGPDELQVESRSSGMDICVNWADWVRQPIKSGGSMGLLGLVG